MSVRAVMGCKLIPVGSHRVESVDFTHGLRATHHRTQFGSGPEIPRAHLHARPEMAHKLQQEMLRARWGAAHLILLNGSVKLIQSKGPANARLLSANACD